MSYFQVRTVSLREGIDQTPCRFDLFKHPVGFLSETISQKHADGPGGHDEGHDHNGTEDLDVFFCSNQKRHMIRLEPHNTQQPLRIIIL